MKRTLITIFLLIMFKNSFEQTDTIKFKQFGDTMEFSELNLNPDKTFEFHHYNRFSCWTWHSIYGTWEIKNNKIVFIDTIHSEEDHILFDTSANNKTDYILLTVKNDYGKPLSGIKIKYALMWSNSPDTYLTDKDGQIRIRKKTIAKQKSTNPSEHNVKLEIHFSNKKYSECSMSTSLDTSYDKIDVTIVNDPKKDIVIRTTTYRIDGNEIYFVDQTYRGNKGYGVRNWGNFQTSCRRISNNKASFSQCPKNEKP